MRILVGTDEGLSVVRWIEGERSGRVAERQFEGRQVYRLAAAGTALWAVVPDEGLFRSTDRGDSWNRVTEPPEGRRVLSFAAAGRDGRRLLLGTEPAAVYASEDGGDTWSERPEFRVLGVREAWRDYGDRAAHVETLAFDPESSRRIYAGVEVGGAYRSDDDGASWTGINEGILDDIHEIQADPRDPSRLLAATGGGLFVSRDRGLHWHRHDAPPGELFCSDLERVDFAGPAAAAPATAVPPAGAGGSTFLLATADGPPSTWAGARGKAGARLWRSTDGGATWDAWPLSGFRDRGAITALAADATQPAAVFAGTSAGTLYHGRLDSGRWSRIAFGLGPVRTLAAR
ncbi:MAG: hypothetical protein RRA92_06030 [Gemmatimonadota bacterium]|nr:hypothetical protein [Gemmatimonadota bacterium]